MPSFAAFLQLKLLRVYAVFSLYEDLLMSGIPVFQLQIIAIETLIMQIDRCHEEASGMKFISLTAVIIFF